MIENKDSLEFMKSQKDYSADIIYADPPYALGSEIKIKENGKPDYKKAIDFMNKWKMPNGEYWEQWFKEVYRSLKHGGYCILFGIDRQSFLFEYYANLSGLIERQNLYWYFISNFPKSSDLSKNIDKHFNAEREILEKSKNARPESKKENNLYNAGTVGKEFNLTKPSTTLAKKYAGYKYSISHLKQTCEVVMIFQKPYKTGSCLHDVLAYENGDTECCCGALDIEGNRVEIEKENDKRLTENKNNIARGKHINATIKFADSFENQAMYNQAGRYPAQTFITSETAAILDEQSGVSKSNKSNYNFAESKQGNVPITKNIKSGIHFDDIGGCSKILQKCDYENGEMDLFIYNPKVSASERQAGCDELENKTLNRMREDKNEPTGLNKEGRFAPVTVKNNHPTLKPINLSVKILSLFKTPNPQKILFPFAGAGSEIIGAIKAGFTDWLGCEINAEYIDIANARIKYWINVDINKNQNNFVKSLFEDGINDSQPPPAKAGGLRVNAG